MFWQGSIHRAHRNTFVIIPVIFAGFADIVAILSVLFSVNYALWRILFPTFLLEVISPFNYSLFLASEELDDIIINFMLFVGTSAICIFL